ncbi:MAG: [FeFe] hydrogenase H-cluster radical SAM maturase HydE [Chitinivibrionia bacterium]|nr:[FeFe] hydrogenase H-cluster radical SAM maturase HydE [Chitinivibrionia bacterium]
MRELTDKLEKQQTLSADEFEKILLCNEEYLFERAREATKKIFGNKIYIRGLIEFTNYCKCNCFYCGLRVKNKNIERYRLSKAEILECCEKGYALGFRTFVLQGGEDPHFTDEILVDIVCAIRAKYSDCAITLSTGERSFDSFKALYDAGANRYLLRHETANSEHYELLHPENMSAEYRKKCLFELKKIGYQVGCGFMVGSPGQTLQNIVEDLMFIKDLSPQMVGVGPFLAHHDTPFKNEKSGDLRLTLNILAILRLMQPNLLLPATTALATLDSRGRELGIMAGANIVMPNLSPLDVRKKYLPYDNKIATNTEAAESVAAMHEQVKKIGYEIITARGDWREFA